MRKLTKLLLIATPIVALMSIPVMSFHDEGVAHCNGCHTMHNSQDGALIDPDSPDGNAWLLVDESPSDVCLNCHATGLGAVFANSELDPAPQKGGGNFIFLLEDNINDGHGGAAEPITGDAAGHNLDAAGHGLAPDATLTTAPGGTFPASMLGCTSCHDPHGTEDFRLLYGDGRLVQDFYNFANPAPTAEGISIFFGAESNSNHTAYQGGMSAWCSNCHGNFHDNSTQLIHKSGTTMGASISAVYNRYNGSDDQFGAVQASSYLAEVPFEDAANTTSSTAGPSASSQVSCISCHRAHATSAPDAGRWDFSVTFLHEDGVESGSYALPNPYNYPQRSLCNKCHNQDEFDHNPVDPGP
jgi:predicted CXXCH cytochrome family protein